MRRPLPFLLSAALSAVVLGVAPGAAAETTSAAAPQPFASYWHPSTILNCGPAPV